MNVITVSGSGLSQVKRIMGQSGHDLTIVRSAKEAQTIKFDRLLLLGGVDIDPYWYGHENTLSNGINSARDIIEMTLIERAIIADIPVMGICRGHQMMCIAYGGTLHQDIPFDIGIYGHGQNYHDIIVANPLDNHIPSTRVNSYHHQAIDRMPVGFEIVARSQDGIIEGIYKPGYLGIQFHPEFMYVDNWQWIRLFRWLIDGLKV